MTTSQPSEVVLTLGVDTHAEAHVAVALDQLGRRLGTHTLPTTEAGYASLLRLGQPVGPGPHDRDGRDRQLRRRAEPLASCARAHGDRGRASQAAGAVPTGQ